MFDIYQQQYHTFDYLFRYKPYSKGLQIEKSVTKKVLSRFK